MAKQIDAKTLAEIVQRLLVDTESTGELDGFETYQGFMTDLAELVCNYCGGEPHGVAQLHGNTWSIEIAGNDSLPPAPGGIWREYDPHGEIFVGIECSNCGSEVPEIIGCPDGSEVCYDCFNSSEKTIL